MRTFHFLVNPASGGGAAPAAVVPVARTLRDAGAEVKVTYSPGPVGCVALVAESVARDEVVVAVGGDGMLASLAGAVVEAGGLLGIVPSGRGNDFARQLGLASDPESVVRTLLEGSVREVDVIDVDGQVVLGSVYAGVDSLASELVNGAHRLPKSIQYPYAAVRALATYQPTTYRVEVDGEVHEHEAMTIVVANSGFYGKGMHIAPDASLTNGLLDVVIVMAASKLALIRSLPKLYDGSHADLDGVLMFRGRSITLSSHGPVTAYGDGELVGALPLTANVRPAALRVLGG
jgi:diacylglycerol kinase (ATP)